VLGSGGTLRVSASGTQPLSYLWLKDDQPVRRGTNSTLSLTSVQPSSAGAYRVVVSNEVGGTHRDRSIGGTRIHGCRQAAEPVPKAVGSQEGRGLEGPQPRWAA